MYFPPSSQKRVTMFSSSGCSSRMRRAVTRFAPLKGLSHPEKRSAGPRDHVLGDACFDGAGGVQVLELYVDAFELDQGRVPYYVEHVDGPILACLTGPDQAFLPLAAHPLHRRVEERLFGDRRAVTLPKVPNFDLLALRRDSGR